MVGGGGGGVLRSEGACQPKREALITRTGRLPLSATQPTSSATEQNCASSEPHSRPHKCLSVQPTVCIPSPASSVSSPGRNLSLGVVDFFTPNFSFSIPSLPGTLPSNPNHLPTFTQAFACKRSIVPRKLTKQILVNTATMHIEVHQAKSGLIAAMTVFLVLDAVIITARVYVRASMIKAFGWDDATLCLSYVRTMLCHPSSHSTNI